MHTLGICCNKLRSTKKLQMCGRLQPVPNLANNMCQPRLVNLGHCCGTATRQYPLQCPLDILLRFESEQNHGPTPSTGYVAYQYDHKRHAWSCTIASTLCCVLLCAMQQNLFVFSKVSHVGSSHKCATQLQTIDSEFLEHTKPWCASHAVIRSERCKYPRCFLAILATTLILCLVELCWVARGASQFDAGGVSKHGVLSLWHLFRARGT